MQYKGRTVFIIVLIGMMFSSFVTFRYADQISSLFLNYTTESSIPTSSPTKDGSDSQKSSLTKQDLEKIQVIYQLIEKKYVESVDHEKIMTGAIRGMINALDDPYTQYMDVTEAKQFNESVTSSFEGIGAEVSLEEGKVVIVSPIKNSPAEKAGLQPNDIIVSVNGEKLEGLTLAQAVLKIRGPKGTEVKLEIVRKNMSNPLLITVIRDEIDVETVFATMLDNQIGKIEIRQFATQTADRFEEELALLEDQEMKGLIIDVRNNPGGLLNVVIDILKQFLPAGQTIVQVEDRNGERDSTISTGEGKNYPIVVLINKGSASASEILAGALHDNLKTKLVGETTFGKGTVQVTFENELGDGSNLKITTFKWLTPLGTWIHKTGIQPDIAVAQPDYFQIVAINKETTLKPDIVNEDVKNVQLILKALGFNPGRQDGYFSESTTEAVKLFQKQQNLTITGEVNADTAGKLEAEIIKKMQDPNQDLQLKAAMETIINEISN